MLHNTDNDNKDNVIDDNFTFKSITSLQQLCTGSIIRLQTSSNLPFSSCLTSPKSGKIKNLSSRRQQHIDFIIEKRERKDQNQFLFAMVHQPYHRLKSANLKQSKVNLNESICIHDDKEIDETNNERRQQKVVEDRSEINTSSKINCHNVGCNDYSDSTPLRFVDQVSKDSLWTINFIIPYNEKLERQGGGEDLHDSDANNLSSSKNIQKDKPSENILNYVIIESSTKQNQYMKLCNLTGYPYATNCKKDSYFRIYLHSSKRSNVNKTKLHNTLEGTENSIASTLIDDDSIQKINSSPLNHLTNNIHYPLETHMKDLDLQLENRKNCMSFFRENGFWIAHDVFDHKVIDAARAVVNHALGKVGAVIPGGEQIGMGKLKGGYSSHPQLTSALLYPGSPLYSLLEEFFGVGNIEITNGVQIALRFPEIAISTQNNKEINILGSENMDKQTEGTEWHIDGTRQGKMHPFSLLVGVAISDQSFSSECGNLIVWPGSHLIVHELMEPPFGTFKEEYQHLYGKTELFKEYLEAEVSGETKVKSSNTFNSKSLGSSYLEPLSIRLKPGDVVLVHPKVAHCGGRNLSSFNRMQLYFRVSTLYHETLDKNGTLSKNIFAEFPFCNG